MIFSDIINLSSDEETEGDNIEDIKPNLLSCKVQDIALPHPKTEESAAREDLKAIGRPNNITGVLDFVAGNLLPTELHPQPSSFSPGPSRPLCRQFWKSGDYVAGKSLGQSPHDGQNYLRIHPQFLHSNATSHKWAFGAIAELLDNAVDEVQTGATFVTVDKFIDPRNGDIALLIQDDGGGMDPKSLRRCMSFGFSDKHSTTSIGQYGNGFKTSTMRLGADVIVFSRCMNKRVPSQSVGLLSYTFLRQSGCDDIVVPVVDYELNSSTGAFERQLCHGQTQDSSALSTLLQWSPFASEDELLKQFNDIGHHGTRIVVFNLWLDDDGKLELDFESDTEDIMIGGLPKVVNTKGIAKVLTQKYIANRLRYSLRAYASVLYLRIPDNFSIILRGRPVEPYYIVNDLDYLECIKYRPQVGGAGEGEVVTFLGYLKGAPNINVHGFNVYHKNRLILPFWQVANNSYGKGRGVAGVLEANFVKPTHDKQDFEKSTLFQKLESRLKEMTYEYWDFHCHLLGYTKGKAPQSIPGLKDLPGHMIPHKRKDNGMQQIKLKCSEPDPSFRLPLSGNSMVLGPTDVNHGFSTTSLTSARTCSTTDHCTDDNSSSQARVPEKRKNNSHSAMEKRLKRQAGHVEIAPGFESKTPLVHDVGQEQMQVTIAMMQENKKLHEECLEYERTEKQLLFKAQNLRNELEQVELLYKNLRIQLNSLDEVKEEKL